jgi:hypothetical protein
VEFAAAGVHGYLAHKKTQTPEDHHRALATDLLQGPTGRPLLVSEVPLYIHLLLPVWASGVESGTP